ncbi:MAG: hypothetical protein F4Y16_05630 [Holophagales bacterium]|nr:hypothetical protein [Holophagales bacterium]MYH27035.1 hypothetical protein [Holophagales bacterium]
MRTWFAGLLTRCRRRRPTERAGRRSAPLPLLGCLIIVACAGAPDAGEHATEIAWVKKVMVHGVPIYATNTTGDDKLLHAAGVLAQFLDNDEDGEIDNPKVHQAMLDTGGTIVMTGTQDEAHEMDWRNAPRGQGLYDEETELDARARGVFDAALEEIWHMVTDNGYGVAYPEVFGTEPGTALTDAMDIARGGAFDGPPDEYPEGAWYTYDDVTCDYGCMASEYIYWVYTSMIGAQDLPGRLEQIGQEWPLNTPEKLQEGEPVLFGVLNDPEYRIPMVIPDGNYEGASLEIEPYTLRSPYEAANRKIRRDKFDLVLPEIMRERGVDMWIHVMRESIPDSFGIDELGSASGVFVFTDRGGDRIERAILGRRWGATQRGWGETDYRYVEESGAYDIVAPAVRVQEPVGGPLTEYDYRFEGLRDFVAERDPDVIAVNFKHELGSWPTYRGEIDGLSHTDYLLLSEELGATYAGRLISSEWLMMDYINHQVPSEVELLKRMRRDELWLFEDALDAIEPGVTRIDETELTIMRRMRTGQSQRGRSEGWEDAVVQGGDIVTNPSIGMYAYVLRDGETEPPPEIQELWAEYLKVDAILAETIKAGRTPREIIEDYTARFEEAGIVVRDNQLHMVSAKNDFPAYAAGFDTTKTHISMDSHGQTKGARPQSVETYFGPRIGSLGPDWSKDIPLAPYHHFVIEYFFYLPSPGPEGQDQYLFWWAHEEALAGDDGIEFLSPPQTELILIR